MVVGFLRIYKFEDQKLNQQQIAIDFFKNRLKTFLKLYQKIFLYLLFKNQLTNHCINKIV